MTEAIAQETIDDLDETIPMQTLEHILQDSETPASTDDRDAVAVELQRLVSITESMEQRLEQISAMLARCLPAIDPSHAGSDLPHDRLGGLGHRNAHDRPTDVKT